MVRLVNAKKKIFFLKKYFTRNQKRALIIPVMSNITWDDVPEKMVQWDSYGSSKARCFSCEKWGKTDAPFGDESFVLNYDEEHGAVPVCHTCAEGRVG